MEGYTKEGDVVKIMSHENCLCSSILNGYEWSKMGFVKARKEEVAVVWTEDERGPGQEF